MVHVQKGVEGSRIECSDGMTRSRGTVNDSCGYFKKKSEIFQECRPRTRFRIC
jgi:hypothetical protein